METDIPVWSRKSLTQKSEQDRKEHRRDIFALAVLFALFRLMIPFWFRPLYSEFEYFLYPFVALSNADFVGKLGPALPFIDYWLEYPPVFPWIAVGIYKIQTLIAGTEVNSLQAFYFSGSVSLFLGLVDIANLCLIYSLAKKIRTPEFALRAAATYALLFFPLVVMCSYFDALVMFTILLSLWAMVCGHVKLAAAVAGIGIMTKFIPVILIPAAVKYAAKLPKKAMENPPAPANSAFGTSGTSPDAVEPPHVPTSGGPRKTSDWNRLINYFGTLVLTVGVLAAPFLFVQDDLFVMPFRVAARRPGWETIRALVSGRKDFGQVGPTKQYLAEHADDFGSPYVPKIVELSKKLIADEKKRSAQTARMISRFSTDLGYLEPSDDPLKWPMLAVLGVLYLCAFFWAHEKATPLKITALTGMTAMTLFIFSHGWSPQFIIYVLPFALIALAPRYSLAVVIVLSLINFVEMPVWLGLRLVRGPEAMAPLLWTVVILRTLFLAGIGVALFLRATSSKEEDASRTD